MAFVHPSSCECSKSELDLFSLPPTQTGIEKSQWVEHRPLTTLTDDGPIEFHISGSGEEYVDLSETYLMVTATIKQTDGTNLQATETEIGPVNYWLHSLFSQIDLSLNERLVTSSTNTYPYRAYLETLLSYGPAAKSSHLTSALWYKDTHSFMEDAEHNDGLKLRRKWITGSNLVTMIGKPHLDLFFQDRLMLNGLDMRMRLVRSKDTFSVMGNGKVKIKDVCLYVRKVKLHPTVQLGHLKALERATAKYPIRRVETKVFSVPQGNMSVSQENVFLGQLPKRIVIGCVKNSTFNGQASKNPFNFEHFNLDFLALYVDGMQVPTKPLKPKLESNEDVLSYASLFMGTGQMGRDDGNNISREEYANGYTLFAFDLTPDLDDSGHFHLVKTGNLRLELHFQRPLEETINVIVYGEFDNVIEVDRARNVLFDYST